MASNGMVHREMTMGLDRTLMRGVPSHSFPFYMGTALDVSDHQVYQALQHDIVGESTWILGVTTRGL